MRTINLVHEMKEFKKEAPNPPCLVIITAKQNTVTKMSEAPLPTDIMLQRKKLLMTINLEDHPWTSNSIVTEFNYYVMEQTIAIS